MSEIEIFHQQSAPPISPSVGTGLKFARYMGAPPKPCLAHEHIHQRSIESGVYSKEGQRIPRIAVMSDESHDQGNNCPGREKVIALPRGFVS